jgi:DNA gyrase/topoisomerase IV subunit A
MATEWNNNVPWVAGHGNFGSTVDGPAAERYTECKLRPSAVDLLLQDKLTWETRDNYDGSRQEAIRFNSVVPTVLLNGDSGIAVGYATKLAPHGLRGVVEATEVACKAGAKPADLAKAREALIPDFPTGCDIVRDEQLTAYGETGSGSIRCRARAEFGTQKREGRAKDRETITFTNLPMHVNPEKVGEQIKDSLERGRFDGVAEVIDESDLSGDRVTVVAKPGIDIQLLSRQLYAFTDLDTRYSAKTLVIDGLKPVELSPVEVCQRWYTWRMVRLERKFSAEQDAKEARLEIVTGFLKAIGMIDKVIATIRAAPSPKEAVISLVDRPFKFTADQARAILEMKLRQLTGLDQTELEAEKTELEKQLQTLATLIQDPSARSKWLFKQMKDAGVRHGEARRSLIIDPPDSYTVATASGERRVSAPSKPKFWKVDEKRGVVEVVKGPRGALIVERTDKVVVLGENGFFKKLPSSFKGGVFDSAVPLALAKKESDLLERTYLTVFTLEGQLKAVALSGADLVKTTSTGKRWLPEGAELVHFGEKAYTVPWVSSRKKKVELFPVTVRPGRPGAKGQKVANIEDVTL